MRKARQNLLGILPKASVGAEIGVWKGDFSAELIKTVQPRKLYLIDPWVMREDAVHRGAWYGAERNPDMERIYESVLQRFSREREEGLVTVRRAPSREALAEFPDNHFDFIYIDGDHEYSAVRQDCFTAFDKVRPGGIICGDDYIVANWWGDGVVRAFHELMAERPVLIRFAQGSQIAVEKRKAVA